MFQATRLPTFATVVGVAPSTTTMRIPGPAGLGAAPTHFVHEAVISPGALTVKSDGGAPAPSAHVAKKKKPAPKPPHIRRRYYVPYASIEDLRSAGLGVINESDAWLTGRPYGLPGTTAIRLTQVPGGYHSPNGFHYNAGLVGAGFGDADTVALTAQVQQLTETQRQLLETQKKYEQSLKRIAFWQMMTGGIVVGTLAIGAIFGIADAVRRGRE